MPHIRRVSLLDPKLLMIYLFYLAGLESLAAGYPAKFGLNRLACITKTVADLAGLNWLFKLLNFYSKFLLLVVYGRTLTVVMIFTERQNRKLLEQLEEQKKRLRMQTQQQTGSTATTGSVFVHDVI